MKAVAGARTPFRAGAPGADVRADRRDSRPVRVGNDAWLQRQIEMEPVTRRFLATAADTAAARRREMTRGWRRPSTLPRSGQPTNAAWCTGTWPRTDFPARRGTFLLCTFWLAQAQALAGDVETASATFERAVAAINDVVLLSEEVDPRTGEMIGNFPQAFSHIGLINAAWVISQAQEGKNFTFCGLPPGAGCRTVALDRRKRCHRA